MPTNVHSRRKPRRRGRRPHRNIKIKRLPQAGDKNRGHTLSQPDPPIKPPKRASRRSARRASRYRPPRMRVVGPWRRARFGALAPTVDASELVERVRFARRIHIIGGPGAGKSTLANRLGTALNLPVHTLDTFAYEGPDFVPTPRGAAARAANEIAASPGWITEGIFVGWTEPLLSRAEWIIWLDHVGWTDAATRIVKRFFRSAVGEAHSRRGKERYLRFGDYCRNTRQLAVVLLVSREYWAERRAPRRYPVTRAQVAVALHPYADKVLRVRRSRNAIVVEPLAERGRRAGRLPRRGGANDHKGG